MLFNLSSRTAPWKVYSKNTNTHPACLPKTISLSLKDNLCFSSRQGWSRLILFRREIHNVCLFSWFWSVVKMLETEGQSCCHRCPSREPRQKGLAVSLRVFTSVLFNLAPSVTMHMLPMCNLKKSVICCVSNQSEGNCVICLF